jgi:hypothetical protein
MKLTNLRFHKFDLYDNPVFISSHGEENFDKLIKYAKQLEDKKFVTYLPIYHSKEHNFATIRFVKDFQFKPNNRCCYNIDYTIKTKVGLDKKTYVNCFINSMKFCSKMDEGVELKLE